MGSELFVFTDNMAAEGAYYRGNSPNHHLFELVRRLRLLDMLGHVILHVIHVAGMRMIVQGMGGLSRGDFSSGVMTGLPMLNLFRFICLLWTGRQNCCLGLTIGFQLPLFPYNQMSGIIEVTAFWAAL
jgi:hypothetical protein